MCGLSEALAHGAIAHVWRAVRKAEDDTAVFGRAPCIIQALLESLRLFSWRLASPITMDSTEAEHHYAADLDMTSGSPKLLDKSDEAVYERKHIQKI